MSACKACTARIVWCYTINGKRIPIDAHPAADGNMRITVDADGTRRALSAGPTIDLLDEQDDGTRYVSHFATCPFADQLRKERMR